MEFAELGEGVIRVCDILLHIVQNMIYSVRGNGGRSEQVEKEDEGGEAESDHGKGGFSSDLLFPQQPSL